MNICQISNLCNLQYILQTVLLALCLVEITYIRKADIITNNYCFCQLEI